MPLVCPPGFFKAVSAQAAPSPRPSNRCLTTEEHCSQLAHQPLRSVLDYAAAAQPWPSSDAKEPCISAARTSSGTSSAVPLSYQASESVAAPWRSLPRFRAASQLGITSSSTATPAPPSTRPGPLRPRFTGPTSASGDLRTAAGMWRPGTLVMGRWIKPILPSDPWQ